MPPHRHQRRPSYVANAWIDNSRRTRDCERSRRDSESNDSRSDDRDSETCAASTEIDQRKSTDIENMTWKEHLKRCSTAYQAEKAANAKKRAATATPARRITGKKALEAPTRRLRKKFRPGEDVD